MDPASTVVVYGPSVIPWFRTPLSEPCAFRREEAAHFHLSLPYNTRIDLPTITQFPRG